MVTVVIDTNVLISALIARGKPRRLVTKLLEEHTVVTSSELLAEFADVVGRVRFFEVKSSQVNEFLSIFVSKAMVVRVRRKYKVIPEDPDDDIVLSTAYDGRAEYVVSGDKHLLNLKNFRGIRILAVKEMLDLLYAKGSASSNRAP